MELVLWALMGIALLVDGGCWLYMLVQIFKREGVMRGLLGIVCGVYAFHYGWRNAAGWDLMRAEKDKPPVFKRMMLVWTLSLLSLIILPRIVGS
jgi:hypothetical protein